MVLGLTGSCCAGKDAVAGILGRAGFHVIDVDEVGHDVLRDLAGRVVAAFGPEIVESDGSIDRQRLGRIVFADPASRARLEQILHPEMVRRVRAEAARLASARRDIVINAAILQRMGLDEGCDAVLFVRACWWRRLGRAMRRDRLPLGQAIARLASQGDVRPQQYGSGVDTYTVRNDRGLHSLERSVAVVLGKLRER